MILTSDTIFYQYVIINDVITHGHSFHQLVNYFISFSQQPYYIHFVGNFTQGTERENNFPRWYSNDQARIVIQEVWV